MAIDICDHISATSGDVVTIESPEETLQLAPHEYVQGSTVYRRFENGAPKWIRFRKGGTGGLCIDAVRDNNGRQLGGKFWMDTCDGVYSVEELAELSDTANYPCFGELAVFYVDFDGEFECHDYQGGENDAWCSIMGFPYYMTDGNNNELRGCDNECHCCKAIVENPIPST